jgi:hypothetical protein
VRAARQGGQLRPRAERAVQTRIPLFLLLAEQLPAWLRPGSWVHAEGAAYFWTPGAAIGVHPPRGMAPARAMGVFVVESRTIAPILAAEGGGPQWVGAEEMLAPHMIATTVRIRTPWRFYHQTWTDCQGDVHHNTGDTADGALAQGCDGTRAVLHYHTSEHDPHEAPLPFDAGDLLQISCPCEWLPSAFTMPLPVHVPVLDLWYIADMRKVQDGEAA